MIEIFLSRVHLYEDFTLPVQNINTNVLISMQTFKKIEYQVNLIAKNLEAFSLKVILNIKPYLTYVKTSSKLSYSIELVEIQTYEDINILSDPIKL